MYWECRCPSDGGCDCAGHSVGMAGFWSDLWNTGRSAIESEAERRMNREGDSAHIAAQNEAVAEFESAALAPERVGIISTSEAIRIIQAISAGFSAYASRLGYPRALAGARDVEALAQRLIQDLGGYAPVPTIGPSYIPPIFQQAGVSSYLPMAAVGVIAYLFLGRKGRR